MAHDMAPNHRVPNHLPPTPMREPPPLPPISPQTSPLTSLMPVALSAISMAGLLGSLVERVMVSLTAPALMGA